MDLVKDFAQRIIEFLQEKIIRLRKMKKKNKWKLAGVVLAVVLVVVVVGRLAVGRRGSRSASAETTVQSATAETGSISTTVEETGTLQQGNTIVLITHDESVAQQASRSIRILDGKVLDGGRPAEVQPSGKSKNAITFVGRKKVHS